MKSSFAYLALLLAGCAETSVTQLSRNQIVISTSAAPECGRTGAQKVASRMAAVETIRRGYDRYVIVGAKSASNVQAIHTGPTYAYTNSTYNGYGNSVYGNSFTTFGGDETIFVGTHDTDLGVVMLKKGDKGYQDGIDARSALGPKWEELVKKGITTCTE